MEQTGFLNYDFQTCLTHLMQFGMKSAPRGSETRELLNYNITLMDPRNRVITFKDRNVNTRYLLGEFIWYLSGSTDPKGILPYSKFWANITNSGDYDGYPKGTVNSNYGTRLFGHSHLNGFMQGTTERIDQWGETIELLAKDKDTRQAILNIHIPEDRHAGNKDVACTLTLQFLIRENALHMIVNMRSNDIIRGFTNDVFQFTMLQEMMQVQLKPVYPDLKLGHYFHNAGSMHIYELHYEMAEKIIDAENAFDLNMIPMDRYDEGIRQALIHLEAKWQEAGAPDDFAFNQLDAWGDLTPYWQTLIKALFLKDDAAMHELFAVQDDD